jgi:hypothetical protein
MRPAKRHARFTPNSDRKSGHSTIYVSAKVLVIRDEIHLSSRVGVRNRPEGLPTRIDKTNLDSMEGSPIALSGGG